MMNPWLLLIKCMSYANDQKGESSSKPHLFTEEERKMLLFMDNLKSLPIPEQLDAVTKQLGLLPVVPDRLYFGFTNEPTGKRGLFASHSSKPFEAISPVFDELSDLYAWLKKHNLRKGKPLDPYLDRFTVVESLPILEQSTAVTQLDSLPDRDQPETDYW